jgi:hypothetical protein
MARHEIFLTGATRFLGSSLAGMSYSAAAIECEAWRAQALNRELWRAVKAFREMHECSVVLPQCGSMRHVRSPRSSRPSQSEQFREDLVSCREAVKAARQGGIRHFVYLSVAHPAPRMKAFQAVRAEVSRWFLNPAFPQLSFGRGMCSDRDGSWPVILKPFYAMARALPPIRDGEIRFTLVTLEQITQTLAWAVENRPKHLQVFELSQIKLAGGTQQWPMQAVARIEFAEPVEETDFSRAE